jgi:hypothetical protein
MSDTYLYNQIDDLRDRIFELEENSHPPVIFVECSECHAAVFEESFSAHSKWHVRTGKIVLK